ncbi:hypothetical protein D3218_07645 [Aureimonas flava]|uniref:Uncharacterized protein n=1 Tax=Aureimonas flava TaxID=2320271 RepID=A0A3A1WNQ4_9HYPH|nr:hypothetical protein [Aureimonas flava]RIY02157.1 hypothetical protein D3218_07645 [Aureimonas flava]
MSIPVDPELSALIREVVEAKLLKAGSEEIRVAQHVAAHGLGALNPSERDVFERRVLPILSKPIREQLAIASIVQRGGYVPRKIVF